MIYEARRTSRYPGVFTRRGKINCLLYRFADASRKAYCAVIHFVWEVGSAVSVTLLTSKNQSCATEGTNNTKTGTEVGKSASKTHGDCEECTERRGRDYGHAAVVGQQDSTLVDKQQWRMEVVCSPASE